MGDDVLKQTLVELTGARIVLQPCLVEGVILLLVPVCIYLSIGGNRISPARIDRFGRVVYFAYFGIGQHEVVDAQIVHESDKIFAGGNLRQTLASKGLHVHLRQIDHRNKLAVPPSDDLLAHIVVGHSEKVPLGIAYSSLWMTIEGPLTHIILRPVVIQYSRCIIEIAFTPKARLEITPIGV